MEYRKECQYCRYYECTWTTNSHGLFFLSNSHLKNYCSNPKGKKYSGGVSSAMIDYPYGEDYFDTDFCNEFERRTR